MDSRPGAGQVTRGNETASAVTAGTCQQHDLSIGRRSTQQQAGSVGEMPSCVLHHLLELDSEGACHELVYFAHLVHREPR